MFAKSWFQCGLVAGLSLLAGGVWAASAKNNYVEVSSSTPGVVEVVTVGLDFHITTANVPDAFVADVEVEAASGWRLLSPDPASFKMSVGEKRGYEVCNENNEEDKAGGDILLFKVDVEIDGVGEDKEVTEGAFVGYAECDWGFDPACMAALKPVRIRCLPANRPDGERIVLTFPPGHLLEKIGTTYQAAQSSYKANEIGGKSFWLHGHAPSAALRDYEIKAEHSVNHCKDEAKHTVVKVDLDIDGLGETEEVTRGGVVVRHYDGNNSPLQKIILRKVEPNTWLGNVVLTRGNAKVAVYDSATAGTEITFNGTDNRFSNSTLPMNLWVKGVTASEEMRDVPLDLSAEGLAACKDTVKFTVLWVDVDKRTTGNVSEDNAGKVAYIDATGADGFGFRIYNFSGALGVEFVGTVHPSNFDQDIVFRRKFLGSMEYTNGILRSSDPTETMDTSDPAIRDDAPQSGGSGGKIYDLDAPGVLILAEMPGDTDARRANFKQWATYTIGGVDVRCTLECPWYLRINVRMKPDSTFDIYSSVEGDNKIDFGTTSLEYNLEETP